MSQDLFSLLRYVVTDHTSAPRSACPAGICRAGAAGEQESEERGTRAGTTPRKTSSSTDKCNGQNPGYIAAETALELI
jgi:hypothetical protein